MSLYHELLKTFSTPEKRVEHLVNTYCISESDAKKLLIKIDYIERQNSWGHHRKNTMVRKYLRKKRGRVHQLDA